MNSCKKSAKLLMIKEIVVWGARSQTFKRNKPMRDALNGENLETIEDFSAWANEVKKEMNAEN